MPERALGRTWRDFRATHTRGRARGRRTLTTASPAHLRMPTNDHTPRGHAARYLPECYEGMRDDKDRTEAYRRAIAAAASGHIVLDIGTGALALLALFAAEAGAKHVYALEVQEAAYEAAKATVAASPFADKVTVIRAFSTDAALTLPAAPTLLVHELIGEVAGEEGVVAAITDARKRHLSPSATPPLSIPSRSRSLVAPCEFPDAAYCESLPSCLLDVPGQSRTSNCSRCQCRRAFHPARRLRT